MTDPLSHTYTISLDHWGNVLSYTDPLSLITTYQYNANGQVTQMTQPVPASGVSSPVTSWQYDSNENLTQITHPVQNAARPESTPSFPGLRSSGF